MLYKNVFPIYNQSDLNLIKITMSSKGVSPMIAAVLLIAFTIAVGGIMSVWLTGYSTTTQQSVENATTERIKCLGTYVDILSVSDWAILYTNRGSETVTNITAYASDGSSINITATGLSSLSPGQIGSISNFSEGVRITNETINFAANDTYYNFANTLVASVVSVTNHTNGLGSSSYDSTTTQIKIYTNATHETGNYNVTYEYTATNKTSFYRGTNTSVIFIGKCLGGGVTGECKSGQTCWK